MPSQDFIKGKADIFSFVLEVLHGVHENRQALSCGEIMERIERYAATPLRDPTAVSADYHAGVADGVRHFREYFIPHEDRIDSDSIKYVYNAVEERWEELIRQLEPTGPKMTLGELWATEAVANK